MRSSDFRVIASPTLIGDGASSSFAVSDLLPYEWLNVLARVDVEPGATVTFTAEISHDNSEWFTVYVHNLAAAAVKNTQAASVSVNADGSLALLGISVYAPHVRITAASAGAAATVSLYGITVG